MLSVLPTCSVESMLPGVPESPRYMTRAFQFTTPFLATRESSPEMATYGSMEAFNPKANDWTTYAERLQHYLQANDVSDQKRASYLLPRCAALLPTNCCVAWLMEAKWTRSPTTS